jgi:NTP pyrophosphatase (non-canonical NTP hydrolase)
VRAVTDLRTIQAESWKNKVAKGFNTTDVPLEFCYLSAEVAEAFDAWRKGRSDLGEELADVALFLVSLAEMNGINLQNEVEAKLAKNAGRTYVTGANGLPVRVDRAVMVTAPNPPEGAS